MQMGAEMPQEMPMTIVPPALDLGPPTQDVPEDMTVADLYE